MDGDVGRFDLADNQTAYSPGPPPPNPAAKVDKPTFPNPTPQPTQAGPRGIRYDFNQGARLLVPDGNWRVEMRDDDTGNILFLTDTKGAFVASTKRYYVRFRLTVWEGETEVFRHEYSAQNQKVLVQIPVGTLGDPIAWLPYAIRFQQKHQCQLYVMLSEQIIPLFKDAYPQVHFITRDEADGMMDQFYAAYGIGLFFDDAEHIWQPTDFRHVGLARTAGHILGVDPSEAKPRLKLPDETRPIAEPYVCIGVQSSSQPKYWNNPHGWRDVVTFLKEAGYRVICIDRQATHGTGLVYNHIPNGAEDETGDRPLVERARWLRHAAFFVGTSSGLSWLAWAAGTPVVMISGFTLPSNEFETPYRVINYHACTGCWNDVRHRFQHQDFLWCPRHAGTERQFECSKLITADQVKNTIRQIPNFGVLKPGKSPFSRRK